MTLAATRYGYTTDGGSNQNPESDWLFCVPVTVTAAGFAVAVECYAAGGAFEPLAVLMANNGGVPGWIIATTAKAAGNATTLSATVRRMTLPAGVWVAAATYFVGVQSPLGGGAGQLRTVTGSSGDGYLSDGNVSTVLVEPGTTGATAPAANSQQYSIQLVVLTDTVAGATGTGTSTLAAATMAAAGSFTVATPGGGTQMGGAGAVRKPPRGK